MVNLDDNLESINFDFFGFDRLNEVRSNLLDILFNETQEIAINDILSKISVSRPYFNFKKVYKYKNILIAQIRTEQPLGNEILPMTIGEAGRHMAILGTCICAIQQERKYYYLVQKAKTILKATTIDSLSSNHDLYIAIESQYIDKRIAHANGIIFTINEVIYHLTVSYSKVNTKVFEKMFAKQAKDCIATGTKTPYDKLINFIDESFIDTKIIFFLPKLNEADCAGHFDNYPILPTAFVIYNILSHIGDLISKKINKKYYISEVSLSLFELLFINSEKRVEATLHNINNGYKVLCKITQDNKNNAYIMFKIHLI